MMLIDYPNNQLTVKGKHLLEVASLFAMGYIKINIEPVKMPQDDYKAWCIANEYDIFTHLRQLVTEGAKVTGIKYFIKMSVSDYQNQYVPVELGNYTFQEWAELKPSGAKFTKLKIKESGGFVWLRPSHYLNVADNNFQYFSKVQFITLTDTY